VRPHNQQQHHASHRMRRCAHFSRPETSSVAPAMDLFVIDCAVSQKKFSWLSLSVSASSAYRNCCLAACSTTGRVFAGDGRGNSGEMPNPDVERDRAAPTGGRGRKELDIHGGVCRNRCGSSSLRCSTSSNSASTNSCACVPSLNQHSSDAVSSPCLCTLCLSRPYGHFQGKTCNLSTLTRQNAGGGGMRGSIPEGWLGGGRIVA
jgi:hypothetical protein